MKTYNLIMRTKFKISIKLRAKWLIKCFSSWNIYIKKKILFNVLDSNSF